MRNYAKRITLTFAPAATALTFSIQPIFVLLGCCLLAISIYAQKTKSASADSDVLLTVGGEVTQPLKITRDSWSKLPRKTITAKDHDGKEHQFEGVALADVLQQAGVKFGDGLRGKALATYLLVQAADNYQAVFALPEFDAPTADRLILLADRQDGEALVPAVGPLKIIAPGDSRQSRWVRQVTSLTIVQAPAPAKP